MADRLGEILIDMGHLSEAQLASSLATQGAERGMLGSILLRRGLISVAQLGAALQRQFDVPFRAISPLAVNAQVVRLLPEELSRERKVVPLSAEQGVLTLAMAAPDDIETISEAGLLTGYQIEPVVALHPEIFATLNHGFDERIVARQTIVDMKLADLAQAARERPAQTAEVSPLDDEAPVVRLVRSIVLGAIASKASDIHLEPHSPEMRVRYRVDGELQAVMTIPKHTEEEVIARIKVMADMDTTETRRPQDGHLSVIDGTAKATLRVSTIPTVGGEKVVLRVLDEGNKAYRLETLGLAPQQLAILEQLIARPHGMILVTGPTGSGKSTTMYVMLGALNAVRRNIITVEDPVEYRIGGVNQVNADNEHGLGFANALKYIMRQDPDVILVGEIRDHETASTAVQAALTGHLLISTLHANDAVGAVARLNDLGVDRFKIGGALLGSLAQRLLRAICPECKEPCEPNEKLLRALLKDQPLNPDVSFHRGRGCKKCLGTGYAGRLPIIEIMPVTPSLTEAIEQGSPSTDLRKLAVREGMVELAEAGLEQVYAGRTTLEELYYRVSG